MFKNIIFFSFETDFVGLSSRETMKIYEYSNYKNLMDIHDKNLKNEDELKIMFLAFNLVINEHEILGHLNIGYQIYSFGEQKKEEIRNQGRI